MSGRAWWLVCAALWCVACEDEPRAAAPRDAGADAAADAQGDPVEPADQGEDLADLAPDLPADLDMDAPDPGLTEAEVTAAGTRVRLSAAPLTLEVWDAQGRLVTRSASGEGASASGLVLGRARRYDEGAFYEPTLDRVRRRGGAVDWFQVARVKRGEPDGEGFRFLMASQGEDGAAGPDVALRLQPSPYGVTLEVDLLGDLAIVHTHLNLEAAPGEGFYGMGEHFDRVDSRGIMREMQIQAEGDSESSTNEVHVPIPFVVSSRGYGLYLDDRHPAAIDPGKLQPEVLRVTTLSPASRWVFLTAPTPMALLERYTDLVGKPAQVPFWALAPQFWRNVNRDQAEVLDDARLAREADIPTTVLWIDRPWSSYYHNWRFNASQFPTPEAMMDELRGQGYRVLLHHSPQMNSPGASDLGPDEDAGEGLYAEFLENEWLVTLPGGAPFEFPWGGGRGAFVDWSHPGAVARVQGMLDRVAPWGVIGTKMDWDEYLQPNLGDIRLVTNFHNGETNLTMKGWYSALYHKAIIEGFDRALGEPSFHVSRSGAAGDQVWNTCIWPGDLDNDFSEHTRGPSERQEAWNVGGLPAAIVANQTLGMSGYPCFASDIGGYRDGQPDEELLLRWMAFGVFNAVTQLGGGGGSHMPWTADSPYSEAAVSLTRRFFRLRMELVPYVFAHLWEAHKTGRPLVRSLWLGYPDDPEARAHERDFLFGPDLLVAPVYVEGATERALYLPAGPWVDWWTGERVEGARVVTRAAPLEIIPVYVRGGGIIPLAEPDIDTLLPAEAPEIVTYQRRRRMRALIAPHGSSARSLYNGLSLAVAQDEAQVTITATQGDPDAGVDPRFGFAPEGITLEVLDAGTPFAGGLAAVAVARGEAVSALPQGEAGCEECWRYDGERRRLVIALSSPAQVTIEAATR